MQIIQRGKSRAFTWEKNLKEIIPEEDQILELLVKDVKSNCLKHVQWPKETMDKELKETREVIYGKNENMNEEIEIIITNHTNSQADNNWNENSLEGFNSRFEQQKNGGWAWNYLVWRENK